MSSLPEYKNLSDFMQKTQVATNQFNHTAVVVMDWVEDKPILLPGFMIDESTPDFEVYEQGWDYWNRLLKELDKDKWPPLNEL